MSPSYSPSETVAGTETVAPRRTTAAPTVLGTEATALPTAVAAGLGGPGGGGSPLSVAGTSLLALGAGLLALAGGLALRRSRGSHQA